MLAAGATQTAQLREFADQVGRQPVGDLAPEAVESAAVVHPDLPTPVAGTGPPAAGPDSSLPSICLFQVLCVLVPARPATG
ncbi:hypothetical protein Atai01_20660 [Amycolatopsis taiwanensis]|uniref:Uncharacterized protein n=1 Tax=Amycolatopsis taiwanensis TaxID=342230 RepID=A0A9W6R0K9_9PSEU|nr:hypothetical protein Atai01_20660 [Amycolatopsis taiwanensis]